MSIFGTPVVNFSGEATFSPLDSPAFAVEEGDLIVVLSTCSNGGSLAITDLDNEYTQPAIQTRSSATYQWGYVLAAAADPSNVVTITPGDGGFISIFIWVVPLSAAALFDVLFDVAALVDAGASLTAEADTTGSDEMCFCGIFDGNAVGGWTTPSPGVLDSAGFPGGVPRWAGMHIQFAAPQTDLQLEMDNAGSPLTGGGIIGIAFKSGGSPPPATAKQPVVVIM